MYTAFVISTVGRQRLAEEVCCRCPVDELGFVFETGRGDPLPHHLTLNLGSFDITLNEAAALGASGELVIDAFCLDESLGVCAARVTGAVVLPERVELISRNDHPHVTMCLRPGVKPAASNRLPWACERSLILLPVPITVTGRVQECL